MYFLLIIGFFFLFFIMLVIYENLNYGCAEEVTTIMAAIFGIICFISLIWICVYSSNHPDEVKVVKIYDSESFSIRRLEIGLDGQPKFLIWIYDNESLQEIIVKVKINKDLKRPELRLYKQTTKPSFFKIKLDNYKHILYIKPDYLDKTINRKSVKAPGIRAVAEAGRRLGFQPICASPTGPCYFKPFRAA